MKKTVLLSAAFLAATAASAQTGEITSNRGENWLSQDGDWGLTFDAQPILDYVGNLFNNGTNDGSTAGLFANRPGLLMGQDYGDNVIIAGKKLVDANTAYRGKLRIGFGTTTLTDLVNVNPLPNPMPTFPTPVPVVEDVYKASYMNVVLGAGLEKRVGSTRVVGVYGGELLFGLGSSRVTAEYGNNLSSTNPTGPGGRITEIKSGPTFGLGLAGFGGIEWFFAPKMSLGGEYTWGLMFTRQGYSETTADHWVPSATDPTAGTISTITIEGSPNVPEAPPDRTSTFMIDTGVSGFALNLNFYFQ